MRVIITPYDENWPLEFSRVKRRLCDRLGARAKRIEHIGSTAVPGLHAKPIVDVLLECHEATGTDLRAALEGIGYSLVVDEPGHHMFRNAAQDVHLHVWRSGDAEIERHLLFRDRLRENEEDRRRYEREKQRLATMEWPTQNDYAQAKSRVIGEILARARESPKP